MNFTESSLGKANFTNADLISSRFKKTNLKDAILEDVRLENTFMDKANLERANFTRANLFDADLTGTALYGAVLDNVKVNTNTEFGDHYPDDGDVEKAAWTLSQIEDLARQNALHGQVRSAFTKRKDRRRNHYWQNSKIPGWIRRPVHRLKATGNQATTWLVSRLRSWVNEDTEDDPDTEADASDDATSADLDESSDEPGPDVTPVAEPLSNSDESNDLTNWERWMNTGKWAWLAITGSTTRYSESPRRVVVTSLVVVLVAAVLYPLLGGVAITTEGTQLTLFEPLGTPLDQLPGGTWLANFYFSLVTFTTLGYGDIQPASAPAQLLAGIESFLGAALMALLVAVLARRITR